MCYINNLSDFERGCLVLDDRIVLVYMIVIGEKGFWVEGINKNLCLVLDL